MLGFVTFLMGCPSVGIRNKVTYQNEIGWFRASAEQSADSIGSFIDSHCSCQDGQWSGDNAADCDKAAILMSVVRLRSPYHLDMMEYLGSVREERPSATPPVVPPSTDFCPKADGE